MMLTQLGLLLVPSAEFYHDKQHSYFLQKMYSALH